MCDPVSATMAVVGVAGAVSSADAASSEASERRAYNQQTTAWRTANMWRAIKYQRQLAKWQEAQYNATAISAAQSLSLIHI